MADIGLKIGLEGEKAFKKSLSEISSTFKVLGSEMKLVESQFGKNESSAHALTAKNEVHRLPGCFVFFVLFAVNTSAHSLLKAKHNGIFEISKVGR